MTKAKARAPRKTAARSPTQACTYGLCDGRAYTNLKKHALKVHEIALRDRRRIAVVSAPTTAMPVEVQVQVSSGHFRRCRAVVAPTTADDLLQLAMKTASLDDLLGDATETTYPMDTASPLDLLCDLDDLLGDAASPTETTYPMDTASSSLDLLCDAASLVGTCNVKYDIPTELYFTDELIAEWSSGLPC
jgi:hypothetical protein